MTKELDMRHKTIIDALPVFDTKKEILTVGCGTGYIEYELQKMGYDVIATDFEKRENDEYLNQINFQISDILDLSSFSVEGRETVICSEVLEHLPDWRSAFRNLLNLTHRKLIITVPWWKSFDEPNGPPPISHCNYWTDNGENPFSLNLTEICVDPNFLNVKEFIMMAWPYHVSITKIATKYSDWVQSSRCYMITVDKTQIADCVWKWSQIANKVSIEKQESGRYEIMLDKTQGTYDGHPPVRCGPYLQHSIQDVVIAFVSDFRKFSKELKVVEQMVHEKYNARLLPFTLDETGGFSSEVVSQVNIFNQCRCVISMLEDKHIEGFTHSNNLGFRQDMNKILIANNPQVYSEHYNSTFDLDKENVNDLYEKL